MRCYVWLLCLSSMLHMLQRPILDVKNWCHEMTSVDFMSTVWLCSWNEFLPNRWKCKIILHERLNKLLLLTSTLTIEMQKENNHSFESQRNINSHLSLVQMNQNRFQLESWVHIYVESTSNRISLMVPDVCNPFLNCRVVL